MEKNVLQVLAKEELKEIKSSHKKITSLRKKAAALYREKKILSDYILDLMGDNSNGSHQGKYYDYLDKKKKLQSSEHMGVGTGDYLEEMIFDLFNEIISKKYHNKYEVVRQNNVVKSKKNKKQDIVIQEKVGNKSVIVLELKSFMGGDNCTKMKKDKEQIEKTGVTYFGYAPYIYTKSRPPYLKENEAWLFCEDIEPLLDQVFEILDNH